MVNWIKVVRIIWPGMLSFVIMPLWINASTIDSIRLKLSLNPSPPELIDLSIDLSDYYLDQGFNDSAVWVVEEAIQIAQKNKLPQAEARGYYALGYAYDLSGKLEEALKYYENARALFEELGIKEEVATCMNSKGVAAYFKGDFELALQHYLATLEYSEEHQIKSVMANTLNNLGVIYRITSKNKEAIEIYHKTLALSRQTENENMIATSFHNLGVAFNFDSVLDSALIYFDSALYHYELLKDTFEIGRTSTAIGEAYYFTAKDYQKARPYLFRGAQYLQGESNQEELSKTYLLMAQVERDDGHFNLAIEYFQEGLNLVEGTDREDVLLDFYKEMEACYNQYNRPDQAHKYLKKYINIYKKVQSTEKLNAIEELQTKYETQEKDKEIALQEITILKSQRQRNLLLGGIMGLFLMGGFIFVTVRRRHAYKAQIAQQENLIQQEKIKRLEQEQKIMALDYMLMGEENERKRIAKDLHDSLGALLASAKLQLKTFNDKVAGTQDNTFYSKTEGLIEHAAQEVRRISHAMMPDALVNMGLTSAIEDLANSINSGGSIHANAYFFDLDEIQLTDQQKVAIYRIIQELSQNVLKHAQASEMVIQLSLEDDLLKLEVEDNGIGLDLALSERKEGMGLKNIRSRVQYLDGSLEINSKQGGPTICSISIPLSTTIESNI